MSIYSPLCNYLSKCDTQIQLTFSQIEQILGFTLPKSAYTYPAWWSNGGHKHASIWLDAGYKVEQLNLVAKTVTFSKTDVTIIPANSQTNASTQKSANTNAIPMSVDSNADFILVHGYQFHFLQTIEPKRDADGNILKYYPQNSYDKKHQLPLLPYGNGAFCRFSINASNYSGVYLWVVNNEIIYIGETQNLHQRFNIGYGNISPRNCYIGGQSTNCKMNKLVLNLCEQGKTVNLYFYETPDHKAVEQELLSKINTTYNVKDNS